MDKIRNKTTYRNEPHLLGGTRLSVLGDVLRRDVLSHEFLLTSPLSNGGGDWELFMSDISLEDKEDNVNG